MSEGTLESPGGLSMHVYMAIIPVTAPQPLDCIAAQSVKFDTGTLVSKGGAEKKVQTPSFKVVEVNESSPEQVLLFVLAN